MDWRNLPGGGGGVQDNRGGGLPGGGLAVGGGLGGLVIALIAMFFGVDPGAILGGGSSTGTPTQQGPSGQQSPSGQTGTGQTGTGQTGTNASDETFDFVDRILTSNDQVWGGIFQKAGQTYNRPRLVLFSQRTSSGCGSATSAVGPFYCPADRKIYLDTSFFSQMDRQLGGGGDFAYSYVIAHEVGHHIQNELGIADKVNRAQQQAGSEAEANRYSVAMELQADCFAGVWGNQVATLANLTQEDVREAVNTAEAIGDDALQRQSRGTVVPDSFTHGSSEQRVTWFMKGFKTGDPNGCDTFSQL